LVVQKCLLNNESAQKNYWGWRTIASPKVALINYVLVPTIGNKKASYNKELKFFRIVDKCPSLSHLGHPNFPSPFT